MEMSFALNFINPILFFIMQKNTKNNFILFFLFIIFFSCSDSKHKGYFSQIPDNFEQKWIGNEFWANRLQDWAIQNNRLECVNAKHPFRTVHFLTKELNETNKEFELQTNIGLISDQKLTPNDWAGFYIGAGNLQMDYRKRSLMHGSCITEGGILAVINGENKLLFLDVDNHLEKITLYEAIEEQKFSLNQKGITLQLKAKLQDEKYYLTLNVLDNEKKRLSSATIKYPPKYLTGNIGIAANGGIDANNQSFWLKNITLKGDKISSYPQRAYGPVMAVQYTLSNKILKLTAQLTPLNKPEYQKIILERKDKQQNWQKIAETTPIVPGYTAQFKIKGWDDTQAHDYRISCTVFNRKNQQQTYYEGTIVKNPTDKDEMVIAAFTGNNNAHKHISYEKEFKDSFNFENSMWFPHEDLSRNIKKFNPDLLVFTGDQIYEGRPTLPEYEDSPELDYLYKWYLWCWAFGDLSRNIPCISIPDDHDVYHGNIWGCSGKKAPEKPVGNVYPDYYKGFEEHWQQDQGGYKMPAEFVNMVQRTQSSNLPDPYDTTKVKQGIDVYYCDMNYGDISFIILEDRKFKSAPSIELPHAKVVNGFSQIKNNSTKALEAPDAKLMGERQLAFMEEWVHDWTNAKMKVSIMQSIFATLSTYPDTFLTDAGTPKLQPLPQDSIPQDYSLSKDMDSNGWPHTGRNKAIDVLRKGYTFMIGGDQHLASIIHHGVNTWNDAGYSFCVPSIANIWPRRWFPPHKGYKHIDTMPDYTGQYFDGFENIITVYAAANPYISKQEPKNLHDRAPGYGIVRLNKKTQKITMECWPRHINPHSSNANQYQGWPLTIDMTDNYGREARAYLPTIKTSGLKRPPVVQIINKNNQIVYTIRAKTNTFIPKVFQTGTYTIKVGEPGTAQMKTLNNVSTLGKYMKDEILVQF